MTKEEKELQRHLELMHMLSLMFSIEKHEHIEPYTPPPTYAETAPSRPAPETRFTALRAKLEAHNKEQTPDVSVSEG